MNGDDLQRSLGRVEGKLDQLLSSIDRHFVDDRENFEAIGKRVEEFNKRVGKVEKKIYWFSGAWAAAGALLAYVVRGH